MKILGHAPFIGNTGYANHARSFFCGLNKYHTVKIRNLTIGDGWKGMSNTPHDNEQYITDEMKGMLIQQTLYNTDDTRSDFPIYGYDGTYKPDVHIVLMEVNGHYFYEKYDGIKIAYCVYESTRFPTDFFNQLLTFDYLWVPTQWQYDSVIEQGYPKDRVFIVREGVDVEVFKPNKNKTKKDRFRFIHFGRWDYRKSTTEIIRTFGETFKDRNDVELVCSVENPYPSDGLTSTQERLKHHNLNYGNIKFLNFPPRDEYVKYLQDGDVFVSCARSEGWNLPVCESMACGTPSIYSNWGGQLEFANGRGIPVKISHIRPANIGNRVVEGQYCEPDFDDLSKKMLMSIDNYKKLREKSLKESEEIHKNFSWSRVCEEASNILKNIMENSRDDKSCVIILTYPDTEYRKKLLSDCVDIINKDIIVSTHYPLEKDVQEKVDWVVYEKNNPLLFQKDYEKYNIDFWHWCAGKDGTLIEKEYDFEHSYTVYTLIQNGLRLAKSIGKENIHIINYDYQIPHTIIQNHETYLKESNLIFYLSKDDEYSTGFFSGKIDTLLEYFDKFKTIDDYYNEPYLIFERKVFEYFNNHPNITVLPYEQLKQVALTNLEEVTYFGNAKTPINEQTIKQFTLDPKVKIITTFHNGPFIEIQGGNKTYNVKFIDENKIVRYETMLHPNHWANASIKYFNQWEIQLNYDGYRYTHKFTPTNKRILISFDSKSVGDTLAWIPYVDEFRKKHNCTVICSTFHNNLFIEQYPDIVFIPPGTVVDNIYTIYRLGYFIKDGVWDDEKHPIDPKTVPLQKIATDILGLPYIELKPILPKVKSKYNFNKKIVSIAIHSTAQCKYWNNPNGWKGVVDYLNGSGYEVVLLSKEEDGYMGNYHPSGITHYNQLDLMECLGVIQQSDFFIGISSGLSWLSWAAGTPTILVSGFTEKHLEPQIGVRRIINKDVCHGCYSKHQFDPGDWNWCPIHKDTERMFECSKKIESKTVINIIDQLIGNN